MKYHLVFIFDKSKGEALTSVLALAWSKKSCMDYMNGQDNRNNIKYRIAEGYSIYDKENNSNLQIGYHGENLFIKIDKFLSDNPKKNKIYYSDDRRVNRQLIGHYIKNLIV